MFLNFLLRKAIAETNVYYQGYNGCPNKWNPYHACTPFCNEKWGDGKVIPDEEYERRRQKMLALYRLPEGWQEVYDPGTSVTLTAKHLI